MTVSYYVTGGSSTFVTLFETERPSSSRQASSVMTLNTISTTAARKGGSEDDEPATIAVTTTAFVVGQQPPLTDTIRSQPTVTVSIAPPPPRTSPSSPASTPHTSSRDCIGDEGSVYTDPGTGDKFKISCAIAHQGMDIMNLKAETMEACINLCAKNNRCKGAVWYNVGPQGTDLNYCWLKSGMNGEVRETQDAQSVTLL
ncbi:hypothetical protein NUW58_g5338 [Xylaria curta]|uniref:Uncharacterized protein n=1 Tax=Xylaria curta TaxID=42375 RepID=A0ACC1P494_9PEZI|nr:hypothetical protein NUW58_g5338 [Xylaria curta]